MAIEDDGVAFRQRSWAQFKKQASGWFVWETAYYFDFQASGQQTNVFSQAKTFGTFDRVDSVIGETGWNYTNGDGVLFYPGTDVLYPQDSYGMDGPIASLRLKHWRRGVQDYDYLTMAAQVDPAQVAQIVANLIPKVLWEYGVNMISDPTWVRTDMGWNNDPNVWEQTRKQLADIIEQGGVGF
ncbi:MAG: DUF4091 domain-containing protein [Deltaproteobacteria bacterium]|nr:DUF4091 domain-containing protein [Deltaproteobacteria bacterium]